MCSRNWRIAMAVPWLAFAAMLWDIWRVYDRLPAVIASHFDIAGLPNGWAPKQQFFTVIIPVSFLLLCLFTFFLSRFPQITGLGWLVMVAEYWGIGLIFGLTHATLKVGLGETGRLQFAAGGWSLIMGLALVVGEIGRVHALRKHAHAQHGTLVVEQRHGSAVMAAILSAIALATVLLASMITNPRPARVAMLVVSIILLLCAIWAFTGFVYRVSTAGLEIRMLGVPIRFIPAGEIDSYAAESCNPLVDFGGWGIRGIGHMRAYIWGGRQCLHVHTKAADEVYLGSEDPAAMVMALRSVAPMLLGESM